MSAFVNLKKLNSAPINWNPVSAGAAEALVRNFDKLKTPHGWVDLCADIGGLTASAATLAAVCEIPVINVLAPPLVGFATREIIKWAGDKLITLFQTWNNKEAPAEAKPEPNRPAYSPGSLFGLNTAYQT